MRGRVRSKNELRDLFDTVLDEVAGWPVEGDEFFLDHVRGRVEYIPYVHTLQFLAQRPAGPLLDIGTGSGLIALCAARMGIDTWALDHPRRGWMKKWLQQGGVKLIEHDLAEPRIPLDSAQFSVVVFQDVIEHLPFSAEGILADVRRLLKPGGELVLCTPNLTRIATRVKLALGRTIHPPLEYFWKSPFPFPGHFREYTRAEIERMIEWGGLVPEKVIYLNRSSALRMVRLRGRHPVKEPSRLAGWRILAQLAFDSAFALWASLGQTVWAVGRKPHDR